MAKIFLSHSHRDVELVKVLISEIEEVLEIGKEEIFNSSAPDTIRTGEKWLDEVFEALKSAEVIIPLMTPSSEKSMWVAFEYGYFWRREDEKKEKPDGIFPLTHTITPPSPLNELEYRKVTDEAELEKFFKDLCRHFSCEFKQKPDLEAIIQQASLVPKLTAEDQQLQLECTLHLLTATDKKVKNSIIGWMRDQDILHDAQFKWMDLQGVDFTSANMQGINLGGCKLQGAKFWNANLENAILGSAELDGAKFQNVASVKNASFQDVDITTYIVLDDAREYKREEALKILKSRGANLDR